MDNQRPSQGPQNRSDLQRDYRERERLAFRNLLGALNEVERTNPRSRRREILRRAAECLRRLGQEQIDLQRQLGVFPNNVVGAESQPEAIILSDEDFEWLQDYLAQWEQQGSTGGPP